MLTTLYYLLETIIVVVPMLLAVAFMTLIERKQLAAMQRRVGPNIVGQIKVNSYYKHFYHTSTNNSVENLFVNRKIPIKPFTDSILYTCSNLNSSIELKHFFSQLKNKGGIYMFI